MTGKRRVVRNDKMTANEKKPSERAKIHEQSYSIKSSCIQVIYTSNDDRRSLHLQQS